MYCISTEKLELRLEIVRVESLLQHEEIIPSGANKLLKEFKSQANLRDPIIVDENNIVLDGNHRAYVFKKLQFRFIPVCKIDYFDENAKLRYWFRRLSRVGNTTILKEIVDSLNGRIQRIPDRRSLREIMRKKNLSCGFQRNDRFALVEFPGEIVHDAISAYALLRKIQDAAEARGVGITYIPCQEARENEFRDQLQKDEAVVWTPRITKRMVVDAAKQKKVFIPKSTRHLIPARPLNINVPSHWLKEHVSREVMDRRFTEYLDGKLVKRFGAGQVIDGRFYEEELHVFISRNE
ncbi:MAG: hypothetical protein GY859_31790 [Desulfobacterales bacterium]|nr:hypothetical protein [Desulfobacterales bacterium]